MLICHLYVFFGEVSVEGFGPFLNQAIYFLIVEFKSSLHVCIHLLLEAPPYLIYLFVHAFINLTGTYSVCSPMPDTVISALHLVPTAF